MATSKVVKKKAPAKTKVEEGEEVSKAVAELFKPLADYTKKDLIIRTFQAKTIEPREQAGKFFVHIYAAPPGRDPKVTYSSYCLFGKRMETTEFLHPGPKGEIIVHSPEGRCAFVVLGNNLYITFNLMKRLNKEILKEVLINTIERMKRVTIDPKKKYVDLCIKDMGINIKSLEEEVTKKENIARELQAKLTQAIREVGLSQNKLKLLREGKIDDSKVSGDFVTIMNIDKIKRLDVYGKVIEVYTKNLYCQNPGDKTIRDIGEFKIDIFTDSSGCTVRWHNLTRLIDAHDSGMNAPHIWSSGEACLGNAGEIISDMMTRKEYLGVIMTAIAFVEEVNIGDGAGRYINKWPSSEKKSKPIEEKGVPCT